MSDTSSGGDTGGEARRSGWWWKFTALLFGTPPIAVYGAEDEIEQERTERAAKAKSTATE